MPILGKEQQPPLSKPYKFVREDDTVAYDHTGIKHSQIAASHSLGESLPDDKRLVDDAGSLGRLSDGTYSVFAASGTCQLRENPQSAREKTVKVIVETTGESVTSD